MPYSHYTLLCLPSQRLHDALLPVSVRYAPHCIEYRFGGDVRLVGEVKHGEEASVFELACGLYEIWYAAGCGCGKDAKVLVAPLLLKYIIRPIASVAAHLAFESLVVHRAAVNLNEKIGVASGGFESEESIGCYGDFLRGIFGVGYAV